MVLIDLCPGLAQLDDERALQRRGQRRAFTAAGRVLRARVVFRARVRARVRARLGAPVRTRVRARRGYVAS